MPPLLTFILRRVLAGMVTLLVVTIILFAISNLLPPQQRALMYVRGGNPETPPSASDNRIKTIIKQHGLDAPLPLQYIRWVVSLLQGDWGWSPTANQDVFPALLVRSRATTELTLYSLLVFIPLGLACGAAAGWWCGTFFDRGLRLAAYIGVSIPPFILAVLMLGIFYVNLYWFLPGRISDNFARELQGGKFHTYSGLLTVDSLLNGRPDIAQDALRHLVLPVTILSLYHWASLVLITRASMIEETSKEYLITAAAKGLPERLIYQRHALPNALIPALNTSALSAVSIVTGVFVVEAICDYKGVSFLIRNALQAPVMDLPLVLGFTIYSLLMVLVIVFVLDLLQAVIDPRYREGLRDG
jgi:peptide/nickel transport system permease protein